MRGEVIRGQIDPDHPVPVVDIRGLGRAIRLNGGCIDENVDPALRVADGVDPALDLLGMGNVDRRNRHRQTACRPFRGGIVVGVIAAQKHPRAFPREMQRRAKADAARSGDNRYFPVEFTHDSAPTPA